MNSIAANPFSTRFISPGVIAYIFGENQSIERIVNSLHSHQWRGQIVGPHGTGKTSLLWEIVREFERRNRQNDDGRSTRMLFTQFQAKTENGKPKEKILSEHSLTLPESFPRVIRIIDGFEQLNSFARLRSWLRAIFCREALIVSTHRKLFLPVIFDTRRNGVHFQSIVAKLTPGTEIWSRDQLAATLSRNHGNIREALFDLYDHWEDKTSIVV